MSFSYTSHLPFPRLSPSSRRRSPRGRLFEFLESRELLSNSAPTVSSITEAVPVGAPLTFTAAEFKSGFSDPDAGDTLQSIKITSLPTHGSLTLSGAAVTKNQIIPTAGIANLTYTATPAFVGLDSFGWNGSDGTVFATTAATATLTIPSAFDILGQSVPIADNQTTPSADNFTDFGSMTITPDPSLQTITRTYTIKNFSGAPVTIGSNAVSITGTDASDFSVVTQPTATTLAVGSSVTFTVQFAPVATGKRAATISVANSSTANPFLFAIQGTGISTNTIAATTSSESTGIVQEGTTQNGSGPGVTNGQIIGIKYTGTLANGTIFDSTAIQGGTPLTFRLDDDFFATTSQPFLNLDSSGESNVFDISLIPGFEYGLQGAKLGEKRTLIINGAAAYGPSGTQNGVVPPNSTLIFDVEVIGLVTKPRLGVESLNSGGTPTAILSAGQKTPTASDNTLFTLSNAASLSQSFKLVTIGTVDATGASVGTFSFRGQHIKITGSGAKDFTVSLNGLILTLTYHPAHPGTQNATLHVLTNDSTHPDFTFAIRGVSTAFDDLATSFNTLKFPTETLTSGAGKKIKVPLIISNTGDTRTSGGSRTNIQIYASNNSTGNLTLLTSENNVNIAGLGIHGTRHLNFNVALPVTLLTGTYSIFAVVNQPTFQDGTGNGTLSTTTEVSTTNDGATSSQSIAVQQGLFQLSGTRTASTLAATAAAVTGTFSLTVQNTGTVFLPRDQQATINIIAHPVGRSDTDTSADVTLENAFPLSLGALSIGEKKNVSIPVAFPNVGETPLAAGTYILEAKVTATNLLNNTLPVSTLIQTDHTGTRLTLTVP